MARSFLLFPHTVRPPKVRPKFPAVMTKLCPWQSTSLTPRLLSLRLRLLRQADHNSLQRLGSSPLVSNNDVEAGIPPAPVVFHKSVCEDTPSAPVLSEGVSNDMPSRGSPIPSQRFSTPNCVSPPSPSLGSSALFCYTWLCDLSASPRALHTLLWDLTASENGNLQHVVQLLCLFEGSLCLVVGLSLTVGTQRSGLGPAGLQPPKLQQALVLRVTY